MKPFQNFLKGLFVIIIIYIIKYSYIQLFILFLKKYDFMNRKISFAFAFLILGFNFLLAQNVNIPDLSFKAYLISNPQINVNGDNEIQIWEAAGFVGTINCADINADKPDLPPGEILDLTGIEAFTSITGLNCSGNQISNLDISNNLNLKFLYCYKNQLKKIKLGNNFKLHTIDCHLNQLTNLDVTQNIVLDFLNCSQNQLTKLDINNNPNLLTLYCENNQITNLNLHQNVVLKFLRCDDNELVDLDVSNNSLLEVLLCGGQNNLTSLDISNNPNLLTLSCLYNKLTSLDTSKNTVLNSLDCSNNQLVDLDVRNNKQLTFLRCDVNKIKKLDVSKNLALYEIRCSSNQLTNLDVSKNLALEALYCGGQIDGLTSLDLSENIVLKYLECGYNNLTNLNLKSGYNNVLIYMNCLENPNLFCIQVDDSIASENYSSWYKDDIAMYNTDCGNMSTVENSKHSTEIFPNPVKNQLNIQTNDKLQKIEIYNSNGQLVKTSFSKNINVEELPKGNYIINIVTDKRTEIDKFIKR